MPHGGAARSRRLSFKCFSYSGQFRYSVRQHSTLTELLQWRFLLLTLGGDGQGGKKHKGVSPKETFDYLEYSMRSCLVKQCCFKAIVFEVHNVVSLLELLMSLYLRGFYTVPNVTTV